KLAVGDVQEPTDVVGVRALGDAHEGPQGIEGVFAAALGAVGGDDLGKEQQGTIERLASAGEVGQAVTGRSREELTARIGELEPRREADTVQQIVRRARVQGSDDGNGTLTDGLERAPGSTVRSLRRERNLHDIKSH